MTAPSGATISCKQVRTHNLKNIDLEFELYKWTTVTGVSGSGKSSLVFDTIFAEAQRRFLETLGTYERQFLQGLPQGDFDEIDNIPAAIALKQTNRPGDARSTVGTAADVLEPLRLLFFGLMDASCSKCGSVVVVNRSQELLDFFAREKGSFLLSVPFVLPQDAKKRLSTAQNLLLEGYSRLLIDKKVLNVEELISSKELFNIDEKVEIVLDRVTTPSDSDELKNRVESVWSQVRFSPHFSRVHVSKLDGRTVSEDKLGTYMVQPYCHSCNSQTTLIQGSDLDWRSVLGACKTCQGIGNIPVVDEEKVIPDKKLSLASGAIRPWQSDSSQWIQKEMEKSAKAAGIDLKTPYEKLDAYTKNWIWKGEDPKEKFKRSKSDFLSVNEFFQMLEAERYKTSSRIILAKYRRYVLCPSCEGARLGPAGRNAQSAGQMFFQLFDREIHTLVAWLDDLKKNPSLQKRLIALKETFDEVYKKLALLNRLSLGSTSIGRRCKTLSGGEYQRVLLSRVIGNGLTDALYLLDEPSVGLGKTEVADLIVCIKELRDLGNTVIMVEHDPTLVLAADRWIELGPGGGSKGGEVVPSQAKPLSLTIQADVPKPAKKTIDVNAHVYDVNSRLLLEGFTFLNCQNLNLEVPFGYLTVVGGASGAGKTTLVQKGLVASLELAADKSLLSNLKIDLDAGIGIWKKLSLPKGFFTNQELVAVSQKAMHRSITSVVCTVLGLMDALRKVFSLLPPSRELGLTASDFSFNGAGGCETCNGKGNIKEDLFFLGEVEKECPDCHGTRYRPDVLSVQWQSKNVAEWLNTSLDDCYFLLKTNSLFERPLRIACKLGLGHLPLGVATSTISGGEAQRLRIAAALTKSAKSIFCVLDEPSRGLSEKDIGDLLSTLFDLCSQGHTFVVVEHHSEFQSSAHQFLRMGPGGGAEGGKIIEREVLKL